jgi:septal ring factor EnvC (AmiA/AmiB activator)
MFVLATMALSAMLYAQPEQENFSRAEVLDIFAQFNPSVLENAKQNPDYNTILETFLSSYQASKTPTSRYELIAVARNFDNSIRLQSLAVTYHQLWTASQMSGLDNTTARQAFTDDITEVMHDIWQETVNLRKLQLNETKAQLKAVSKDKTLSKEDRTAQQKQLKAQIKALKAELKTLKRNPQEYVKSAAQNYVSSAEKKFVAQEEAARQAAQQKAKAAKQAKNLQVKTNNKKTGC